MQPGTTENKKFFVCCDGTFPKFSHLSKWVQGYQGQLGAKLEHVWDSENAELYYGCSEPSEKYLCKLLFLFLSQCAVLRNLKILE
jgi:hypothetical protein